MNQRYLDGVVSKDEKAIGMGEEVLEVVKHH